LFFTGTYLFVCASPRLRKQWVEEIESAKKILILENGKDVNATRSVKHQRTATTSLLEMESFDVMSGSVSKSNPMFKKRKSMGI